MATEKYGVSAQLLDSLATTPVDTSTNVVFIGTASFTGVTFDTNQTPATLGLVNEPVLVTSLSEYEKLFGGEKEGEIKATLYSAAKAAFEIAKISKCWMINVYNPTVHTGGLVSVDDDDIVGAAASQTGIYAVERLFPNNGAIPNVVCVPGKNSAAVLSALDTVITKCNGHWYGIGVYDVPQTASQVSNGLVVAQNVVPTKASAKAKENMIAVWGDVRLGGGNDACDVYGSAVVASLYAANDAKQSGGVPVRTIGNTSVSIQSLVANGSKCTLTESVATQLSADGIVSFLNHGGGVYTTWGDHTSAVVNGTPTDERARYDSNMRVLYHLMNRFQQKYRFSIDKPMTLTMRNDIIQEQNDHLEYLKSIGAVIGDAKCEFRASNNTNDSIALGQFVWNIEATVTPPMKYAELQVAFSSAGYSVYYE